MNTPATRPLRVGLTGGIASGKSTVANLFAALGVPVIDADVIAREVVAPGTPLLGEIVARFGPAVRASDGTLDRGSLRTLIFADTEARTDLETLIHPAILAAMESRCASAGGPYQLLALPLLVEKNLSSRVDRVLVVDAPESLQIRRLQARDGATREAAQAILNAQVSRSARCAAAKDIIANEGDVSVLRDQVETLHARYLALAKSRYSHPSK